MPRFEVYDKDETLFWDHGDLPDSRKLMYGIDRKHGSDPGLSAAEHMTAEAVFALNLVHELDRLLGTKLLNGTQSNANAAHVAKALAEGFQDLARQRLLAKLVRQKVAKPPVWHRPTLTEADDPAHGCEACDGEDICTCPHKELRARCLGCGGKWPDCDPNYKKG